MVRSLDVADDGAMRGRNSRSERAQRGAEALGRSGKSTAIFAAEIARHVETVIPHCAACVITLDPATTLLTSTYKFGDLTGHHEADDLWAELEYRSDDPTRLQEMARRSMPAIAASHLPDGPSSSVRMRRLIGPHGYGDELRMLARANGETWGSVSLFRSDDRGPFARDEIRMLASISVPVARGLRAGLVSSAAAAGLAPSSEGGPTVLIVDCHGEIRHRTEGSADVLDAFSEEPNRSPAHGMIQSLVSHAQEFARGATDTEARLRFRSPSGRWLMAQASVLAGPDDQPTGEVVITIDDLRPPDLLRLLAGVWGLTEREREVVDVVLRGVSTAGIASSLSMSNYTVQDHLKSIFDKAGVRSRRELLARVFFDHYAPRVGQSVAPSGWFWPPDVMP